MYPFHDLAPNFDIQGVHSIRQDKMLLCWIGHHHFLSVHNQQGTQCMTLAFVHKAWMNVSICFPLFCRSIHFLILLITLDKVIFKFQWENIAEMDLMVKHSLLHTKDLAMILYPRKSWVMRTDWTKKVYHLVYLILYSYCNFSFGQLKTAVSLIVFSI